MLTKFLSELVDTYGPYIPFIGSSPPSTSSKNNPPISPRSHKMKHKKSVGGSTSPPKGKGKGKEKSGGNEIVDLKDLPITLPEFANGNDHAKFFPRFSSVLKRSDQDGVGMEDIDTLQMELEAMLSATVVRKMTLKEELDVIVNVERYKGQGKITRKGPASPGKRGLSGKFITQFLTLKF